MSVPTGMPTLIKCHDAHVLSKAYRSECCVRTNAELSIVFVTNVFLCSCSQGPSDLSNDPFAPPPMPKEFSNMDDGTK